MSAYPDHASDLEPAKYEEFEKHASGCTCDVCSCSYVPDVFVSTTPSQYELEAMRLDFESRELRECTGCEEMFAGKGYCSGSYLDEPFCSRECCEDVMERREEHAAGR